MRADRYRITIEVECSSRANANDTAMHILEFVTDREAVFHVKPVFLSTDVVEIARGEILFTE